MRSGAAAPRLGGRNPLGSGRVARDRHRGRLAAMAPDAAQRPGPRIRRPRHADPVIGPPDRRSSGPGIPDLAQYVVRALIAAVAALWLATSPCIAQPSSRSPTWNQLTAYERAVLAPLESDWSGLDATRKQKWLGLARRYKQMTPAEQQRIQTDRKSVV